MVFHSRLGSLIWRKISKDSATYGHVAVAPMLITIRCMSSRTLFVGGLSYATDDQSLRVAFSGFGDVTGARVIIDRDSGRSRGFGFVNFSTDESASEALSAMDGQALHGRNIRVSYANDRQAAPRESFGGGFRPGGYHGDCGFSGGSGENDRF